MAQKQHGKLKNRHLVTANEGLERGDEDDGCRISGQSGKRIAGYKLCWFRAFGFGGFSFLEIRMLSSCRRGWRGEVGTTANAEIETPNKPITTTMTREPP